MRKFNVTGTCIVEEDYMVDIGNKIEKIIEMIDARQYFTINRARQYGKTTTLSVLRRQLTGRYLVASISFEGIGKISFEDEEKFCYVFMESVKTALEFTCTDQVYTDSWLDKEITTINSLSKHITKMCKNNKLVLLVDEVDKASDYIMFTEFLGMLRKKFLLRKESMDFTFHSVILAGVHDIKNLKQKMIKDGKHISNINEGSFNSPWNIAVDFDIDMSFNVNEITGMIVEYENDYNTGMDTNEISQEIFDYTGGYPFLVSRICKHIDENLYKDWTLVGVQNAVKIILRENNTLFDDLFKNLENNEILYELIYNMLIVGQKRIYSSDNPIIKLGLMYGIVKLSNISEYIIISNKIFEIRICNYFITKDEEKSINKQIKGILQYDIVNEGKFNMELCLRKFAEHYAEIFNTNNDGDISFLEKYGRMVFLSYLKPLINGQGFYHIESQFTDLRRMDIVVDFGNQQFIIELKIWHGNVQHMNAYEKLSDYLDSKNTKVGYLLTFDFRKSNNKQTKAEWVEVNGKQIFDVVV